MIKNSIEKLNRLGINRIPNRWSISKVKYIGTYVNGHAFKPTDWGNTGKPILRIQNLSSDSNKELNRFDGSLPEHYLVKNGDILISWSASLGVYQYFGEDSWLNQHIYKVQVNEAIVKKEYFIWLSQWFIEQLKDDVHGSTMQHLTTDAFGSFPILIPPQKEQKVIAEFLNNEISRIDNLIVQKERLIKVLSEKKQALVTQAVTKGFNPNVKLKDSGIDWLGEIPDHWATERTRWLFRERNDRSETGEEELLTVSHITGVTLRSEKDVNMFEAESNEGYKIAKEGDLVINTLWAWMGAMGVSGRYGIVSPAYHVYEPLNRLSPAYIDVIVRLPIFANEVTRYSKGVWSSRLRLYPDGFYEVYFPVPPIEEQDKIVEYLKIKLLKISNTTDVNRKSIELLRERRTALISAAVTGQIEIPKV